MLARSQVVTLFGIAVLVVLSTAVSACPIIIMGIEKMDTVSGTVQLWLEIPEKGEFKVADFMVDGKSIGIDDSELFSILWDTTKGPNGEHEIWAVCTRGDGSKKNSNVLKVTVQNPATVKLGGVTVAGTVAMSADVDEMEKLESVDFLVNGVVVATATLAPFTVEWDTTESENGSHFVAVRAIYSDGTRRLSGAMSLNVAN